MLCFQFHYGGHGWLVRCFEDLRHFKLAIFQPYLDLEAGDNKYLKFWNRTPYLLLRERRASPLHYRFSLKAGPL